MFKTYCLIAKKIILSQKKYFFCSCATTILQSGILLFIPLFYQQLVDKALPKKDANLFMKIIMCVALAYLLNTVLNILKDFMLAKFTENIAFNLRERLNDTISFLQYSFFDKNSTANLIAKYSKDIDAIKENFGYMLIKIFGNIVSLLSASIMLMLLDIRVLFVTLVIMIFYILCNRVLGVKIKVAAQKMLQCNEESTDVFSENCNNVLLTKMYNTYDMVSKKFKETYKKQYKSQIVLEILYSCNLNISCFFVYSLAIIIWLIGGWGVIEGSMSIGVVMAMVNYQAMLLSPLNFFSEFNNSYQSTLSALERVETVLSYKKEKINKRGCLTCEHIKCISLENIVFGYNQEKILNGDSIKFCVGNTYGLLGSSGSGKSTVAKLLLRLYNPESGKIVINDIDIQKLSIMDIRNRILLITQDSHFYKGTIKENVTLWNVESDWNKILALSKEFELENEICRMPQEWNTILTSGADNISGGQKKRLDIIRCISQNPDVIIFDEATAYLDIEKRNTLFKIVETIKNNKIVIFITHNLEEVTNYDVIYAFEKGKINKIESAYVKEIYR